MDAARISEEEVKIKMGKDIELMELLIHRSALFVKGECICIRPEHGIPI